MSTTVNNNYSGGIGLFGATFLVFLTLKLCGVINWSWWWVTAPLWGGLALWLAIILFMLLMAAFFGLIALIFGALNK